MRVPMRFRWRWRYVTVKLYGLAVCRWIGQGLQGMSGLWRDTRYEVLAVKLEDARSPPMRAALGDRQVTTLYNDLLQHFTNQG